MIYTTYNLLREHWACTLRYRKLGGIRQYGEDTPITPIQILDSNGLDDALWALRAMEPEDERDRLVRLYIYNCVVHVLPLYENQYPGDRRIRNVIETSRLYADGKASADELREARKSAQSAAIDIPLGEARDSAWAATWEAFYTTEDTAVGAFWVAGLARTAAGDALSAAGAAEEEWQVEQFRKVFGGNAE